MVGANLNLFGNISTLDNKQYHLKDSFTASCLRCQSIGLTERNLSQPTHLNFYDCKMGSLSRMTFLMAPCNMFEGALATCLKSPLQHVWRNCHNNFFLQIFQNFPWFAEFKVLFYCKIATPESLKRGTESIFWDRILKPLMIYIFKSSRELLYKMRFFFKIIASFELIQISNNI